MTEPTAAQMRCGRALYGPPATCMCGTCPPILSDEELREIIVRFLPAPASDIMRDPENDNRKMIELWPDQLMAAARFIVTAATE